MYVKPIFIFHLMLLLGFWGCKTDTEKLIIDYEWLHNTTKVNKIQTADIYTTFYADDSVKILQNIYDSVFNLKLIMLNKQLGEKTEAYMQAYHELQSIENLQMKKAYGLQVQRMLNEKDQLEKIINIYKNTPEKTQLIYYIELIEGYKRNPDSIIAYTLDVIFEGKQGVLPKASYSKCYIFNAEKNGIIGEINPRCGNY